MIVFEHVNKVYPSGIEAVRDLCLTVEAGETMVLLGTSGSGKTTTMKMVNRLIEPSGGKIRIDGCNVLDRNPVELRRSIGYAIQHIGLFPHMTVAQNIAVVPSLLGWPAGEIEDRVDRLLAMVGLEPEDFRDRFPGQLSGGQKQRIGVARALAADPPVVLMDEPFGALDPITREQLQNEFLSLESEIEKTIVFVTHDIFEAVKMGDRIALLDNGVLQQLATPAELVENPANPFVDDFLGQHRFQLALLTRSVRAVVETGNSSQVAESAETAAAKSLDPEASLIDALDWFKRNREDEVALRDRHGKLAGVLRRSELVAAIGRVIEAGGSCQ